MLTDTALRDLKPKSKIDQASDRDRMYVTAPPGGGAIPFRRHLTAYPTLLAIGSTSMPLSINLLACHFHAVARRVNPPLLLHHS
jgi:hypothetical protein